MDENETKRRNDEGRKGSDGTGMGTVAAGEGEESTDDTQVREGIRALRPLD